MIGFTKEKMLPIFDIDLIKDQSLDISETTSKVFIETYETQKNDNFLWSSLGAVIIPAMKVFSEKFGVKMPRSSLAAEYLWAFTNTKIYWLMDVHEFLYDDLYLNTRDPNWTYPNRFMYDFFYKEKPYIEKTRYWNFQHEQGDRLYQDDGWDVSNMAFFLEGKNSYCTFYEWDQAFRTSLHKGLGDSERGGAKTLVDFMDFSDEDCRRDAYRDKIDPVRYGQEVIKELNYLLIRHTKK